MTELGNSAHIKADTNFFGCKRIALDDNLAIALVFNIDKQMYINFEMIFALYSENQEQ